MNRYTPLARQPLRSKRKKSRVTKDGRVILEGADYTALIDTVYERDGGICQLCKGGHWIHRSEATLDHLRPRKMGGGERRDTLENVVLACWLGNTLKGSRRLA